METLLGLVRHAGNTGLMKAVEMSILATTAGISLHLHTEGLRGTGKTSVLRAASRLLPPITRLRGCRYNCDPAAPHCPQHRGLSPEQLAETGVEQVPMPFLEISHSAKIGTVAGSIDLGRLVSATDPAAALLPGTLPLAHRGIILVDEINRLAETAPELADILLDAMGTRPGRVQIEETGLPPVSVPVVVSIWAASNPDEDPGPLEDVRRQLSDRFDFVVPTGRPAQAATVLEVLEAFEAGLNATGPGRASWADPTAGPCTASAPAVRRPDIAAFATQIVDCSWRLRAVAVPPWMRQQVADLYARFGLESLRSAQAMVLGMKLHACLAGRQQATWDDLRAVAPPVLHHRLDGEALSRLLQHLANAAGVRCAPGQGHDVAGVRPLPAESPVYADAPVPAIDHLWRPAQAAPRRAETHFGHEGVEGASHEAPSPPRRTFWQQIQQALGLGPTVARWQPPTAPAARGQPGTGTAAPHTASTFSTLDPAGHPPQSPPAVARPISQLPAADWVKTAAELMSHHRGS